MDRQTIKIVVAVLIGGLAVLLDSTIVSVALRSLAADLDASLTTIQWVTTAYLLAVGVTVGFLVLFVGFGAVQAISTDGSATTVQPIEVQP